MTKDFIQRVITNESETEIFDSDGVQLKMVVSRSRTTNGFSAIRFSLGKQTFEVTNDVANYEFVVYELADMLRDICNNPCAIPSVEQPK